MSGKRYRCPTCGQTVGVLPTSRVVPQCFGPRRSDGSRSHKSTSMTLCVNTEPAETHTATAADHTPSEQLGLFQAVMA